MNTICHNVISQYEKFRILTSIIRHSLLHVDAVLGIHTVLVSLMAEKAEIKYDPACILPNQIASKVGELGYNSTVMETETAGQATLDIYVCSLLYV